MPVNGSHAVMGADTYAGCHVSEMSHETLDRHGRVVAHLSHLFVSVPIQAMNHDFVTVSQARTLTGKSERTIRRFLKANVTEHPDYFEMETHSGRDAWLINVSFLGSKYPLTGAGQDDTVTSRDNAGGNVHGAKKLQREWQENKENLQDKQEANDRGVDEVETSDHDKSLDSATGANETEELWSLVKDLQEQVKEKDRQLDRYYTSQQDMMKKMSTLMEQGNFLLAQSQGATINTPEPNDEKPLEAVVVDPSPAAKPQPKKAATTVKKVKSSTSQSKPEVKQDEPRSEPSKSKKNWWSVFSGS